MDRLGPPLPSSPPLRRILIGLAIAPGIGALVLLAFTFLINQQAILFRWGVYTFFAYSTAIMLGTPAYFWLSNQINLTAFSCSIVCAIIAVLPVAIEHDDTFKGMVVIAGASSGFTFWLLVCRLQFQLSATQDE